MSKPAVSVIVPAWNAEPFLERCLQSIQAQSLEDFEVWVIDPSSTDYTGAIARDYCETDSRFHLVSIAQAPCGIARNAGLDRARGTYISFVDADDTAKPDMLEAFYATAREEQADIVSCDLDIHYPNRSIAHYLQHKPYKATISTDGQLIDYYYRFMSKLRPNNYGHTHFYRREFVGGLRHKRLPFSEDHQFNFQLLEKHPYKVHIDRSLYNYIQREDSIMRQAVQKEDHGALYRQVFDVFANALPRYAPYAKPVLAIYAFTRLKSILFYGYQAGLEGAALTSALSSFLVDDKVQASLRVCLKEGYLGRYCEIHGIEEQRRKRYGELITACLAGGEIPVDKELFA